MPIAQAELVWLAGKLHTEMVYPTAVTDPSTNQARRRATSIVM